MKIAVLYFITIFLCCSSVGGQIITTVAGTGSDYHFGGDGGAATAAKLFSPSSVFVDSIANIYIVDQGNNRIRKVSPSGIISTIAGIGTAGLSGDGGAATSAKLNSPSCVFVDKHGNVFFSDQNNNRIRKVSSSGIITTVAGSGSTGYYSGGYSGDGGQATNAQLNNPSGVFVDDTGIIYIADAGNQCIRKINLSGSIATIAGVGGSLGCSGDGGPATNAQFASPTGIFIDSSKNIFIADCNNCRIRKIDTNNIVSTVAGSGSYRTISGFFGDGYSATISEMQSPSCISKFGNSIYIVDGGNQCIRKVSSGVISTCAGIGTRPGYSGDGGQATSANFASPQGIFIDRAGNMYIADAGNNCIRKISTSGVITTVAGINDDGAAATLAQLRGELGVFVDSSNNVYVSDANNNRIRKVSASGIITTVAGVNIGGYSTDGGAATVTTLGQPSAVFVDRTGNILISDFDNNRIRNVSSSGVISTLAGHSSLYFSGGYSGDGGMATDAYLNFPAGIFKDNHDNLYVVDRGNNCIRKVDVYGVITTIAGIGGSYGNSGDGGPATDAQLACPKGVFVDAFDNIFIADQCTNSIRKINAAGIISTIAGASDGSSGYSGDGGSAVSATLNYPTGIVGDALGNLYISDSYNHRVRKVDVSGIITTLAGNGSAGFSGDGGPASVASLNFPTGISLDRNGNIYLADEWNHRIRKINVHSSNHSPIFNSSNPITLCQDYGAFPISEQLAVKDLDAGQTLTWSIVSGPRHGTASVSYSDASNGFIVRPTGVTYTPATGYAGYDTMVLNISDGIASSTSTFRITVNPKPSAPVISGASTVCQGGTTTLTATPSGGFWGSMDGNTRTGTTTGIVTGMGGPSGMIYYNGPYNAYGCRTQTRTLITVLGYPAMPVLTGAPNVCPGASTTISASAAGGTWASSSAGVASVTTAGIVTGILTGTASISYAITNGCFTSTGTKSIYVASATTVPPITGTGDLHMPATITLANSLSGGTWSSVSTSVAIVSAAGVVTGIAGGYDTIVYAYTNSCGITTSVWKRIHVYAVGGRIAAVADAGFDVLVYPNPTTGCVTVQLPFAAPTEVEVFDMLGMRMAVKQSNTLSTELDLGLLPVGVYLLRIHAAEKVYTRRVVVE